MATSSILGGARAPTQSTGRDTDALGPSDSSDSGSDVQGERAFDALDEGEIGGDRADLSSDTDAAGTGERGAAVYDGNAVEGADIGVDRIGVFGTPDIAEPDAAIDLAEDEDIEALASDDTPAADADDDAKLDDDGAVEDAGRGDDGDRDDDEPTRRTRR
jgi:hypothetical protein